MASPAPALVVLRDQLDARWPTRRKQSDGIMGDAAHRRRRSAHNQGDALDVTNDPQLGPDLLTMVSSFAQQMRSAPAGRLALMVFDRRIWSPRENWTPRLYTGPNPHTTHAHIEIRPDRRNITRPWSIQG